MALKPLIAGSLYQSVSLKPVLAGRYARAGGVFRELVGGLYFSSSSGSSSDTSLSTFTVEGQNATDGGTLNLDSSYVGDVIGDLTVVATPTNAGATVGVKTITPSTLIGGSNELEFNVTAQDGVTTQHYNVTLEVAFVPSDIAGWALLLDPLDITGLSTTDPVTTWPNDGSAADPTQSDAAKRPLWIEDVIGVNPAVRFDGAGDCLDVASSSFGTSFTVFAVIVPRNTQIDFARILEIGGYNVHSALTTDGNTPGDSSKLGFEVNNGGIIIGDQFTAGEPQVFTAAFNGTVCSIRQNGVLLTTVAQPIPASGTQTARIGEYIGGSGFSFNGDILYLAEHPTLLNDAQIESVEGYFGNRFSLSLGPSLYTPSIPAPYFLLPSFEGTLETARVLFSADGETFSECDVHLNSPTGSLRDPAFLLIGTNLYCAYTTGGFGDSHSFGISVADFTSELCVFQPLCVVDCSAAFATVHTCWSPIWFVNPDDSSVNILVSLSGGVGTGPFKQFYVTAQNSDLDSWNTPTEIGGVAAAYPNTIAGFMRKDGATFQLWVKDEAAVGSGGKYNVVLSSSSAFSGYTTLHSGNWAGWGQDTYEGVYIVSITGGLRAYMDNYANGPGGMFYSDSTDGGATWTAPVAITAPSPITRNGLGFWFTS